jgi:methyl-accepting chemotaxis protein
LDYFQNNICKGVLLMKQERSHQDFQRIAVIAEEILNSDHEKTAVSIDKFFTYLLIGQWILGIVLSYVVTPKTYLGVQGQSLVWMAVLAGGFLTCIPVLFHVLKPGADFNRYLNIISQSLFSVLFIHLTGGRIETHFHVFASLALFAFYADNRVLFFGTFLAIADQLIRGIWFPESIFGSPDESGFRWVEHVSWLVFEATILLVYSSRVRFQFENAAFARAEYFFQQESLAHHNINKNDNTHVNDHSLGRGFKDHLENISAALAEITGMVEANVRSAENVNSVAGEVHGVSESTRHVMEELTSAMQNILESNERIEKLVKIIEQVAEKTEVIDDIVFKTQLLSFNASVEAERAGDHGRGFAVVAQEVGNLAQMSGVAATEIASIVKNSIREADQVAAENKSRVERGGDLVAQTRDKTSGVLNRITEILHATDQIVAASREQSQGISEITKSINMLSQSSHDSENNLSFSKSA